MKVQKMKQIR